MIPLNLNQMLIAIFIMCPKCTFQKKKKTLIVHCSTSNGAKLIFHINSWVL